MEPTIATIHQCLGDLVFGEDDEELEHAVIRSLAAQHKTLATAEWGSGGIIAHWFSEIPTSAEQFLGDIVVRNHAALHPLLGITVDPIRSLKQDEALVASMAQASREKFSADYGLAIGELPTADQQSPDPPLLSFAIAGPNGVKTKSTPYAGHPEILKTRGAKQALNLLRLILLHSTDRPPLSPS
jgi:nicotinamide-nucleotide amidase